MNISKLIRKTFVFALIPTFLSLSMPTSLQAATVGNDQLAIESALQIQRDEVTTFMARDDVRSSLLGSGVSASDVDTRINNLSDSQILQIHAQMDTMPAGGEVLGTILVILVIFILLDVAGATDIFPGI